MNTTAYIGLGSNLGDSQATLHSALRQLENHSSIAVSTVSSFYGSTPHGPQNQPDYVNAVCAITTTLSAQGLLHTLQQIENQHGRERTLRWGARTLDLDLLLYGDELIDDENLTVPHPYLCERSFVVIPLMELKPELALSDGRTLADCLENIDHDEVWRLA